MGGERRAVALEVDGKWYVGPDNGIFNLVLRRARQPVGYEIGWRPPALSASFHGRDIFAPVAAWLALGVQSEFRPIDLSANVSDEWPDDLACVLYIDPYGNAISGLRSHRIPVSSVLQVHGHAVPHARVFSEVPRGQAFWYGNANGLVEIAVNRGSAAQELSILEGDEFIW